MKALARIAVIGLGLGLGLGLGVGEAGADAGNAWHIPENAEALVPSMRAPVRAIAAGASITITSGNQFQGAGGNPGNQLQTGSAVLVRRGGAGSWDSVPLTFLGQAGNNKYFSASIDAGAAGELIEYYLRIAYSDHDTTFVHGTDSQSFVTLGEAAAQAAPYSITVRPPLSPDGDAAKLAVGASEARVYTDSGHVAIASGDRELALAPAAVKVAGRWQLLGRVMSSTESDGAIELVQQLGTGQVTARLERIGDGVARYEVIDWGGQLPQAIELAGASAADERYYGFGEKFSGLDQSGKVVRMLARDPPGDKGDQSYKVAPWFVSSRGFGLYFDSTAESVFDMRASAADRFSITQSYPRLSYVLIAGDSPAQVLERYTGLTGRPPLPPPWVFGPWMSSDIWRTGGEVRYVIEKYRELGIPGSVFVFDSPWEVAYNDFSWNMQQFGAGGMYDGQFYDGFASVGDMMQFLRDNGFKVVVWLTPFINTVSNDEGIPGQNTGKAAIYDEAAAAGYFVRSSPGGPPLVVPWWKGQGSPIDFTNPAARSWLQGKLSALVAESGGVIGGFKADDGESDFIPVTARYFDGRSGVEMKNGFSVEYHESVYGVLGANGVLFSRSGFAGTQAFPACWAGDNEPNFGRDNGLESVVLAGLSAAMSGFSIWGHDIGGYQESNPSSTPENLFVRWTQFGAMSPIMQMHRQVGGGNYYPWSYGDAALDNYRTWAELHTQLFPYLYTFARQSADRGLPILRPLPLAYPDDPRSLAVELEYLLGTEILVAPVLDNDVTSWSVYLPPGVWYDWFSGERFDGGNTIEWRSTDQSLMPLFVRAGGIVPMLRDPADTLVDDAGAGVAMATTALDVRIYAEGSSELALYDDTRIGFERDAEVITVDIAGRARPMVLRVRGGAPERVTVNGDEITGWTVEGAFLRIPFDHAAGDTQVEILYSEDSQPPGGEPPTSPAGGCGCRSGGGSGLAWAAAAFGLLLVLRRRRGR